MLEDLIFRESGLNEVPGSIRHVSSTINLLDLSQNCITTLGNMENIVFHNLTNIYLSQNCIYHLNHMSLHLPALSYIKLSENHLTHLDDMSTCQWGLAYHENWFVIVNVENNPWHCNGSMLWLQSSLCYGPTTQMSASYIRQPQGLIIGISRLICHSPAEFQGKALVASNKSALNKLKICSKCEYHLMISLSFRWSFVFKYPKFKQDTFSKCVDMTCWLQTWDLNVKGNIVT